MGYVNFIGWLSRVHGIEITLFPDFLLQPVANGLLGNDGNKQAIGHEKPAKVLFLIGSQRIRHVDLQLYLEFKPKQMSRDCLDAIFYQNEAKD